MTPLEIVLAARGKSIRTDGITSIVELDAPASRHVLGGGQSDTRLPFPPEVAELLKVTLGFQGPYEGVTFDPGRHGRLEQAFPVAFEILADGAGNAWIVDVNPKTGEWGMIFYSDHETNVVVLQARSLAEFLLQCTTEPQRLEWVHDERSYAVANGETREAAFEAAPAELRARVGPKPAGTLIADFCQALPGDGFDPGRENHGFRITRIDHKPIFIIEPTGSSK